MNNNDLTQFLAALSDKGVRFCLPGDEAPPGGALRRQFNDLFYAPHAHRQLEMICLLRGSLALNVNGRWLACPRDTAMVFVPGVVHGEHYLSADDGYRLLWATVLPAALLFHATEYDPLTSYNTSKKRLAITPPMCPQLWRAAREPDFAQNILARARFHYLLMECVEYILANPELSRMQPADFHEQIIEQIKHYIGQYFWEDISLAKMAAIVHYSPGHLNAVFRRSEKMPLHRYINEVRLLQARQLLQGGDLLVKQAAAAVGFKDPLYFSRIFASRFGIRPAALRPARRQRNKWPASPPPRRQASLQVISTQKRSSGVRR